MRRSRTVLEVAFEQAMQDSGKPLRWYGRRLAEVGASPKQVDHAIATLRAHLRRGNASFAYASRVAHLLGIGSQSRLHDLLLKPRESWPRWATVEQGSGREALNLEATGTPGKSGSVASRTGTSVAARPGSSTSQKTVRARSNRTTVLEVL